MNALCRDVYVPHVGRQVTVMLAPLPPPPRPNGPAAAGWDVEQRDHAELSAYYARCNCPSMHIFQPIQYVCSCQVKVTLAPPPVGPRPALAAARADWDAEQRGHAELSEFLGLLDDQVGAGQGRDQCH